jgi:hypothetical protein
VSPSNHERSRFDKLSASGSMSRIRGRIYEIKRYAD